MNDHQNMRGMCNDKAKRKKEIEEKQTLRTSRSSGTLRSDG